MSNNVIEKFADNPSEETMEVLINTAKFGMTDNEIASLALILARSGTVLNFSNEIVTADIPSTGGMGSLSTLICPLVLKELGFSIPKMGIVGRPAGGIDVLYQIPDYRVKFSSKEIQKCINQNQYCHFLVGDEFAPLDARFFSYRAKVQAKAIPELVIASILAKKISAGVKIVGLDVRVSVHGNFGTNSSEALLNSKRFIAVASLLNIKAVCFINDFSRLHQPYVGRGESLIALNEIFRGSSCEMLRSHLFCCIDMGIELNSHGYTTASFPLERLMLNFENNLLAQESTLEKFQKKVEQIFGCHTNILVSPKSGFLKVNNNKLRETLVHYQHKNITITNLFPDPCGVIFKKQFGDFIKKGEAILTYRLEKGDKDSFVKDLYDAIKITESFEEGLAYVKVK